MAIGFLLKGAAAIARHAGVEQRTAYTWADMETVPVFRVASMILANKDELDEFFTWEVHRGDSQSLPTGMHPHLPLADDLLKGATAIADFVGLPDSRPVYHWADLSDVPVFRVGGSIYARGSELRTFFSWQAHSPTKSAKARDGDKSVIIEKSAQSSSHVTYP